MVHSFSLVYSIQFMVIKLFKILFQLLAIPDTHSRICLYKIFTIVWLLVYVEVE